MLVAERAARIEAEAKARSAEAKAHARALEIAKLKFAIAKLRHQRFGQSAERGALIEQLELQLADLEEPRPNELKSIRPLGSDNARRWTPSLSIKR